MNLPGQRVLSRRHPSHSFEFDTRAVADVLARVVQQEGPIHRQEAARRTASNWQIQRIGHRVQASVDSIARNSHSISVRGDFFRPKGMKRPPVRVPAPGDEPRSIEMIASEEIQEAAIVVLRQHFGMTRDDLVRETARVLGHTRVGRIVRSRIDPAISQLIRNGGRVALG